MLGDSLHLACNLVLGSALHPDGERFRQASAIGMTSAGKVSGVSLDVKMVEQHWQDGGHPVYFAKDRSCSNIEV